ncbi:MAG: segregation and condensation protein A [Phycisphaerae bacterium]
MNEYKVALDVYNGPLDLLLFLIRREEVDIYDIPIARITAQYIAYVELLERLDPESASEFLVLAATLMEIKSRTLLPRPPADEVEDDIVDPRVELVRQLLAYKTYKDAAYSLESSAVEQARRHARHPVLPPLPEDEIELENLEIWDLFDAFRRLLEQTGRVGATHAIRADDTPVALHAADIVDSIERAGGTQPFTAVFAGRSRSEMIGLFLALLELVRQRRIRVSQDRPFDVILIHLIDASPIADAPADGTGVDHTDAVPPDVAGIDADPAAAKQAEAAHTERDRTDGVPAAAVRTDVDTNAEHAKDVDQTDPDQHKPMHAEPDDGATQPHR